MVTETGRMPPKVLIIDDSRMVRASIIKHIRGRFEFREEADGESGWQALVIDPTIEVVLTDIGMPQLDGYGLLERIRGSRLPRLQHMPVIVISGDEDDAAREKARQLGADDFITKGTGPAELLARLDSMSRLAQARRELEESRAALAEQQANDSITNVMGDAAVNWDGAAAEAPVSAVVIPEAAEASAYEGGITAMVIDIDHFNELASRHGVKVAELVARKLSRILSSKVRQEDTVAQLGPSRFTVLSPLAESINCCAFALRLQKAIRKLVMTYRDDRIRISVTAGVAGSAADGVGTVSHLVGLAAQRAAQGTAAGGNRVVNEKGIVNEDMVERVMRQSVSIDQVLLRLRMGDADDVRGRLPEIVGRLMPLFELIESEFRCGMPTEALARVRPGVAATANDKSTN